MKKSSVATKHAENGGQTGNSGAIEARFDLLRARVNILIQTNQWGETLYSLKRLACNMIHMREFAKCIAAEASVFRCVISLYTRYRPHFPVVRDLTLGVDDKAQRTNSMSSSKSEKLKSHVEVRDKTRHRSANVSHQSSGHPTKLNATLYTIALQQHKMIERHFVTN
jgi:hypothetical protein